MSDHARRYTASHHDHERDLRKHEPSPRHQKRAVIELVGYLHGLLHPGSSIGPLLSPEIDQQLRSRMKNVCIEFDLDPPGGPQLRKVEVA